MPYQVLLNGAMLEEVLGVEDTTGREKTSVAIYREGQIIKRELAKDFRKRYDDGDDYARSAVVRGSIEHGDEGEELFVPDADAESGEVDTIAGPAVSAELARAQVRIRELEESLRQAEEAATEPGEGSGDGLTYDDLSPEALKAEAEKKGVEVKRGDGRQGDPLKSDYVKALEGARSSS